MKFFLYRCIRPDQDFQLSILITAVSPIPACSYLRVKPSLTGLFMDIHA